MAVLPKELDLLAALQHTQQWYAERWERLRKLIHDDACHIEDDACCIMANGTADPMEPPTYAQLLNAAKSEAYRLEHENNALLCLLAAVFPHAEGSLRDPNIIDQAHCALAKLEK